MELLLILVVFFALLPWRFPIALAMLTSAFAYVVVFGTVPLELVVQRVVAGVDSYTLLAIPMFLLAGHLMSESGMTHRLVDFALALVGRFRGGLAQVNIGANVMMSGVSGSAVADSSAVGSILIPSMKRSGYDRDFSAALTGAGAAVGPLVPPSIPMIVYAATANVSIGAMFLAGAVPGLVLASALALTTWLMARKKSFPAVTKSPLRDIASTGIKALPALLMPVIIVASIVTGAATATESAAIAVAYTAVVGVAVYRGMPLRRIPDVLVETVVGTVSILFLLGAASAFGWVLTLEQAPQEMLRVLEPVSGSTWLTIAVVTLIVLVLGTFMEGLAILILVVPVLMPAMMAAGVDPIQFGTFLVFAVILGTITPPVGVVMFVVVRIADGTIGGFVRASAPYYICALLVLGLVCFWSPLSTWLPARLG